MVSNVYFVVSLLKYKSEVYLSQKSSPWMYSSWRSFRNKSECCDFSQLVTAFEEQRAASELSVLLCNIISYAEKISLTRLLTRNAHV